MFGLFVLVAGLAWVAYGLVHDAPHEVEIRVGLRAYRDPPRRARAVTLTLLRGGEVSESAMVRFPGEVPAAWDIRAKVRPGEYVARIEVETDQETHEQSFHTTLEAGRATEFDVPP